ncbi:disease resistance protein Roq1 isoform X2 [Cryptomeria japonica]|uniref:disease resistance protein Roq1 isoform X2 n=1 Tax=Cryptomeria japonica TaxID=3369 RepID=UPI0027DA2806|nr:disease resistance protein Roq1 isoform X2 [Cryptomeria japonica]
MAAAVALHLPFFLHFFFVVSKNFLKYSPLCFGEFQTFCNSSPIFMASSSSSPHERSIVSAKQYDVFISHRGPDVKQTIAKQLYELFKARECRAFLDRPEIEAGDSITSAIDNAICSSRVQIAIFSKGYAESSWCLDELVLMLQQTDALFIPVFYNVQPWELRHIDDKKKMKKKKKSQYAAAFSDYRMKGRNLDKLDEWKKALASAADISGYELSLQQEDLCEKIVSRVVQVVQEKEKSIPLHVAKYPIGLGEVVQDFERCCSKTVGIVGIFGLGGSGKTTLAKELFNKRRSGYHTSCFISDVRESHARGELHSLQSQLFKALFDEDRKFMNIDEGLGKLKDRLGRARLLHFLIVFDDIDHQHQLDALLPEGVLGSGSLVIITTRDKNVIRTADFLYKMMKMEKNHAKNLFCSHAFRRRDPPTAYDKLVESFVEFCGGLPLSLSVLGAHVYAKDDYYWELELEKVKKIQPNDIMQRLKISFDGLDREEKQIFIDIACLFNKKNEVYDLKGKAITIWKASGWSAEHAVQTLQDKCLLELVDYIRYQRPFENYKQYFEMHDHLRDLGRQMADDLGPPRLWRPDILRSMGAKGFKEILAETKGRCFHSFYDSSLQIEITYFTAETDLLWLETRGSLLFEKLKSIPSWIPLQKLQCLSIEGVGELWSTFQQQLQNKTQASFELRKLWIRKSSSLQKLPTEMFIHLEELYINSCLEETNATSFVQSVKQLSNLRSLVLESGSFSGSLDSINLDFSTSNRMDSLKIIQLYSIQKISKLVISGEMCPRLQSLEVQHMHTLEEIELKQLERLNTLEVSKCWQLESISGLSSVAGLRVLRVYSCGRLKSWLNLAHLCLLEQIKIYECPKVQSVEGVEELRGLKSLMIEMPDDGYASVHNYVCGLTFRSLRKSNLVANVSNETIEGAKLTEQ